MLLSSETTETTTGDGTTTNVVSKYIGETEKTLRKDEDETISRQGHDAAQEIIDNIR
ncbi:MAG: hypothetical protein HY097_04450 [Nitrospinae bacterium]|nr:hypothetical protein [Nitrospinota bacterium]MBI3813251.1 hypothetical protein [Nitrospinota bacterium]